MNDKSFNKPKPNSSMHYDKDARCFGSPALHRTTSFNFGVDYSRLAKKSQDNLHRSNVNPSPTFDSSSIEDKRINRCSSRLVSTLTTPPPTRRNIQRNRQDFSSRCQRAESEEPKQTFSMSLVNSNLCSPCEPFGGDDRFHGQMNSQIYSRNVNVGNESLATCVKGSVRNKKMKYPSRETLDPLTSASPTYSPRVRSGGVAKLAKLIDTLGQEGYGTLSHFRRNKISLGCVNTPEESMNTVGSSITNTCSPILSSSRSVFTTTSSSSSTSTTPQHSWATLHRFTHTNSFKLNGNLCQKEEMHDDNVTDMDYRTRRRDTLRQRRRDKRKSSLIGASETDVVEAVENDAVSSLTSQVSREPTFSTSSTTVQYCDDPHDHHERSGNGNIQTNNGYRMVVHASPICLLPHGATTHTPTQQTTSTCVRNDWNPFPHTHTHTSMSTLAHNRNSSVSDAQTRVVEKLSIKSSPSSEFHLPQTFKTSISPQNVSLHPTVSSAGAESTLPEELSSQERRWYGSPPSDISLTLNTVHPEHYGITQDSDLSNTVANHSPNRRQFILLESNKMADAYRYQPPTILKPTIHQIPSSKTFNSLNQSNLEDASIVPVNQRVLYYAHSVTAPQESEEREKKRSYRERRSEFRRNLPSSDGIENNSTMMDSTCKSNVIELEASQVEDQGDELSRMSVETKLQLFRTKEDEIKETTQRRRISKQRRQTQPVTLEDLAAVNLRFLMDEKEKSKGHGKENNGHNNNNLNENELQPEGKSSDDIKNTAVKRRMLWRAQKTYNSSSPMSELATTQNESLAEQSGDGPSVLKRYTAHGKTLTQPITLSEKEEIGKTCTTSIKDRLSKMQTASESWRDKSKETSPTVEARHLAFPGNVKSKGSDRPKSVYELTRELNDSRDRWKEKVNAPDASAFTIEGKMRKAGVGAPFQSPLKPRKANNSSDSSSHSGVLRVNSMKEKSLLSGTRTLESSQREPPSSSPRRCIITLPSELLASCKCLPLESPSPATISHSEAVFVSPPVELRQQNTFNFVDEQVESFFSSQSSYAKNDVTESFSNELSSSIDLDNLNGDSNSNTDDSSSAFMQPLTHVGLNRPRPAAASRNTSRSTQERKNKVRSLADRTETLSSIDAGPTQLSNKTPESSKSESSNHVIRDSYINKPSGIRQSGVVDVHASLSDSARAGLSHKEDFTKMKDILQSTSEVNVAERLPGFAKDMLPYKPIMLIQVKGRYQVQCRLVEPVLLSVNQGDCFILLHMEEQRIYHWVGEWSNQLERAKSRDLAKQLAASGDLGAPGEHKELIELASTLPENERDMSHLEKEFWKILGWDGQKPLKDLITGGGAQEEDELYEEYMTETNCVYRVSENGQLVPLEQFWGRYLRQKMLKSDEEYVFDFGTEVYLWTGKNVNLQLRRIGVELVKILVQRGYDYSICDVNPLSPLRVDNYPKSSTEPRPAWVLTAKITENGETFLFKTKFSSWPADKDSVTTRLFGKTNKTDGATLRRSMTSETGSTEEAILNVPSASELISILYGRSSQTTHLVFQGRSVGRGNGRWTEARDGILRHFEVITHNITAWKVLPQNQVQLISNDDWLGQFYEDDTCIVRWRYAVYNVGRSGSVSQERDPNEFQEVFFLWQGRHSKITEKTASALVAIDLNKDKHPQLRVEQNHEPPCFLRLFDGSMTIHNILPPAPLRIFLVRGEHPKEMHLLEITAHHEVACKSQHLNSNVAERCTFCPLRTRSSVVVCDGISSVAWLWHGRLSPAYTREGSLTLVHCINNKRPPHWNFSDTKNIDIREIEENSEPPAFFTLLHMSATWESPLLDGVLHPIRMWAISSCGGEFLTKELQNPLHPDSEEMKTKITPLPFFQNALYNVQQPAIFLIDSGTSIYVWQGWWPLEDGSAGGNVQRSVSSDSVSVTGTFSGFVTKQVSRHVRFHSERLAALQTALYMQQAQSHRISKVLLVSAGLEPEEFQQLFPFWVVDEEATLSCAQEGRSSNERGCGVEDVSKALDRLKNSFYSIEWLTKRPYHEDVNPLRLESYLTDDDFEKVLKVSKDEFYQLPFWKRRTMKQSANLS